MKRTLLALAVATACMSASAQDSVVGTRVEVGPVSRGDGGWANFRVSTAGGGLTLMEVTENGSVRLHGAADLDLSVNSFVPLGGPPRRQVGWLMVRVDGEFVLIPAYSPFAGDRR